MHRYIFLFTGLLLMRISLVGQVKKETLSIQISQNLYNNSDTVKILIKNQTQDRVYFQISLQKKIKGKWVEVLADIFRTNEDAMAQNVLYINEMQQKAELWYPKYFIKNNKNINGCFRFKFVIGRSPSSLSESNVASEFYLK